MSGQDVLSPPYDAATDHEVSILEAVARPRPALGEVRLPPGGRPRQQAVRGTTATDESVEGPFVRIARRYSLCDDDAWEAFARALEIIARNRHRIRHETAVAYMAVVVRNEALAVRRQRTREAPLEAAAYELTGPGIEPDEPDRDPRLPALRAAMRELRPDDRRALLLFYALPGPRRYQQIMRATGWSYAKVNRSLTRGRTRLRKLLATEVAGDG